MAPRKISEEVRREKCRNKEARRAEQINGAFNSLLKSIPYIPETQRPTMPKIKTLRLAMKYIQHLSQILEGQWAFAGNSQENPRPLQFDDFKYIADGEIKVRNSYRERAQQTEMDIEVVHRIQQRTEAKRKQRCSETTAPTLLPPQTQPPHVFYSTSSPTVVVPPPTNQYSMPQYPALPRVDTVYGSCSPPDLFYQNPLMSSDEEWRF